MSFVSIPRNSSRLFSKIPYSSANRRESVATRSVVSNRATGLVPLASVVSSVPSRNTPIVTAVLPMSMVSSMMVVTERYCADSGWCRHYTGWRQSAAIQPPPPTTAFRLYVLARLPAHVNFMPATGARSIIAINLAFSTKGWLTCASKAYRSRSWKLPFPWNTPPPVTMSAAIGMSLRASAPTTASKASAGSSPIGAAWCAPWLPLPQNSATCWLD